MGIKGEKGKEKRCEVCGRRATWAVRFEGPRRAERVHLCERCRRDVARELDRRDELLPVVPGEAWVPNPDAPSHRGAGEGAGDDEINVVLHTFPEEDWPRATALGWVDLPYREVRQRIEEALTVFRRRGLRATEVVIGVEDMLRRLAAAGLEDTRENRMTVAADYARRG